MLLADRVSEYVDAHKPWELAKQQGQDAVLHDVCTVCIEAFRVLTIYLKPVLPALAAARGRFPQVPPMTFADASARARPPRDRRVQAPDAARRPAAARQALRAAQIELPPPGGGPVAAEIKGRRLRQRSTCASPRSSPANRRGRRQAAAPDARRRRARRCNVFSGIVGLQARTAGRQVHGDGRQPGAAQDEVRRQRRHGAGRQPRRRKRPPGALRAGAVAGRDAGLRVR